MTLAGFTRMRFAPALVGFGTLVAAIGLMQALIQFGFLNKFIVPPPSDIFFAFERVIVEEQIIDRFFVTLHECVSAAALLAVFGISIGTLLYKVNILRQATETWVAAAASAPTVLMYPLFMVIFGRSATTIIMMGFVAGLPAVILKTIEGLSGTKHVLMNVGRSFNLTPVADVLEDPVSLGAADDLHRLQARADLRAHQCRRRGIPDQFRRARPAHQRSRRTL